MNQKVYRILIVLICSMFLFATTSFADTESKPDVVRMQNQSDANNYYATLLSSFTNENGEIEYPDYYGGSYLDNIGNLVISLCNNNYENRQRIKAAAGTDRISFTSAKNSYKDLYSAYEEFNSLFLEPSEYYEALTDLICEYYIDENNKATPHNSSIA